LWIYPIECFHLHPQGEFPLLSPENQMAHAPGIDLHNPNQDYPMNASNIFQLCQDGCPQEEAERFKM
jgi:hypothetical protein